MEDGGGSDHVRRKMEVNWPLEVGNVTGEFYNNTNEFEWLRHFYN